MSGVAWADERRVLVGRGPGGVAVVLPPGPIALDPDEALELAARLIDAAEDVIANERPAILPIRMAA